MLDVGYSLPLTNNYDQQFNCVLPIDGKNLRLTFRFRFNHVGDYWFMTVMDSRTNEILLDGIPLIEGNGASADLLFQYAYMEIGSAFLEKIGPKNLLENIPTALDIPENYRLVWSDTI